MITANGIAPEPEMADVVTDYDVSHFLTYARLLDAEAAGADWREAAAQILGCDIVADVQASRACWANHLSRARWIAREGYAQIRQGAGLPR